MLKKKYSYMCMVSSSMAKITHLSYLPAIAECYEAYKQLSASLSATITETEAHKKKSHFVKDMSFSVKIARLNLLFKKNYCDRATELSEESFCSFSWVSLSLSCTVTENINISCIINFARIHTWRMIFTHSNEAVWMMGWWVIAKSSEIE